MKRFVVSTPEELREIAVFVTNGNVESVAAAWSVSRRLGSGVSLWDGHIHVAFEGRKAVVQRVNASGNLVDFAKVKYNLTLAFCRDRLSMCE